jgi:hypothetical protein
MTTQDAADKWGIKVRRIQTLCDNGKVENAVRLGHIWVIPKELKRLKIQEQVWWKITNG